MSGAKFDKGKPSLELLPPSYWEEVGSELSYALSDWYFYEERFPESIYGYDPVSVLEFGAKKYKAHNWHKGMRWGRLVGAFHRHVNFFDPQKGLWLPRDLDEPDEESGMPHGQHAECCRMFLQEYYYQFRLTKGEETIGTNDCAWNEDALVDTDQGKE